MGPGSGMHMLEVVNGGSDCQKTASANWSYPKNKKQKQKQENIF